MQGIVLIKPDAPFGFLASCSADQWLYFFTLAVAVADVPARRWNLLRGRIGRAMIAIRDHPIAADRDGHQPAAATSR